MNHIIRNSRAVHSMAFTACALLALAFVSSAWATPPTAKVQAAATAEESTVNMIGDFEGKSQTDEQHGTSVANSASEMGWGWLATDDARVGGQSSASVALVHPGVVGTKGALQASGELKSGFIAPWAGVIWFPGEQPMQAADLSAMKVLSFWVRGTPGEYAIMLMAGSPKNIPEYASFQVGDEWTQVQLSLEQYFHYTDMEHVYFIAFSAAAAGKFQFELDQVQLQ